MLRRPAAAGGAGAPRLNAEGLRALTHGRVDAHAGLPKGSTSNHFRTRAALLRGVVEWMVQGETPDVAAASPASPAEFVDELCRLFEFMTGPNRTMTTARLVLLLEAGHDAELRQALVRGRTAMESTVVPALAHLGARDPLAAGALAVCFEGLFLHRIARHADLDPRPILTLLGNALLA